MGTWFKSVLVDHILACVRVLFSLHSGYRLLTIVFKIQLKKSNEHLLFSMQKQVDGLNFLVLLQCSYLSTFLADCVFRNEDNSYITFFSILRNIYYVQYI